MNKERLKHITETALPPSLHKWLHAQWQIYKQRPPVGWVRWGSLRRLHPINRRWNGRGQPIDRYYIEQFLSGHASDMQGRMLEIGDNKYTRQFGGDRVTQSDVLHVTEGNPIATIVGDLSNANHIPSDCFDCFILTQTLQYIYDLPSALKTIYRILKPGGVVLVTLPNLTPLIDPNWNDCWYWGFTSLAAQRLFTEVFPIDAVTVESHGNVLAAIAFLQGLSTRELKSAELDFNDTGYPVLITVRAVKPGGDR